MSALSPLLFTVFVTTFSNNVIAQTAGTTNNTFTINSNDSSNSGEAVLKSGAGYASWHLRAIFGDLHFARNLNPGYTSRMVIKESGFVGIGTTEPTEKLEVQDGNLRFRLLNGAGGKSTKIEWFENAPGNDKVQLSYFGQNLNGGGRGMDRLIFSNGDWLTSEISDNANMNQEDTNIMMTMRPSNKAVGIGTLNPKWRLDVTGPVNASEYRINGALVNFSGGTNPWTISGSNISYTTGNVGIGTASPTQKLDVNGNLKLNGDLLLSNSGSTLPVGLTTEFNNSELLSAWSINWLASQPGYDITKDGGSSRIDMRTDNLPLFQWYYRPENQAANGDQMIASISKEGNLWTKYLSVSADYPAANEQNEHMIPGTVAHFDGRVYISEVGGTEKGFSNEASASLYYQDYLLWVEEGIVSKDFAIATTTDWPDYVFSKDYKLPSLAALEQTILEKGHLPTMPSAKDIEEKGFTVNDMTKRLVKTIEELTLHTIEQQKHIDTQKELIEKLAARLTSLEQQVKN